MYYDFLYHTHSHAHTHIIIENVKVAKPHASVLNMTFWLSTQQQLCVSLVPIQYMKKSHHFWHKFICIEHFLCVSISTLVQKRKTLKLYIPLWLTTHIDLERNIGGCRSSSKSSKSSVFKWILSYFLMLSLSRSLSVAFECHTFQMCVCFQCAHWDLVCIPHLYNKHYQLNMYVCSFSLLNLALVLFSFV